MEIRTKADFYRQWRAGTLGNHTRVWETVDDALAARPLVSQFGLREIGRAGGGAWELVPRGCIEGVATLWKQWGRRFILDDACPNERTTLCGEVCRTFRGLESHLAIRPGCSVRMARRLGLFRDFGGAVTHQLLEHFCDPSSRDDVLELLEMFPDATIELSCFDTDVGAFPNRNTLIWEVRNY